MTKNENINIIKEPILTVAIPTYQRRKWLKKSLVGILNQISDIDPENIEIIVSENHGVDGSYEWLLELSREFPILRVFKNPKNLGAEGNFRVIPSLAKGKYLWILSDDDVVEPMVINKIISLLNSCENDYLVLNFSPCDEKLENPRLPCWNTSSDLKVCSIHQCLKVVPHFAFGFLSCWICKRELFNLSSEDEFEYFKRWGLSICIDRYMSVRNGHSGLILAESILNTRRPPIQEYPDTFNYFEWFFEGSYYALNHLKRKNVIGEDILAEQLKWIIKTHAVRRILFERSKGVFNRDGVMRILDNGYKKYKSYWLMCMFVAYFPGLGWAARNGGAVVSLLRTWIPKNNINWL
jgi:glycosyltransferase involved in cell wall biosynthesis